MATPTSVLIDDFTEKSILAGSDGEDPLHSLKQKIVDENKDIGLCLWEAAKSGSAKTLKLILQLPYGKITM